jgi:hypothetical protein
MIVRVCICTQQHYIRYLSYNIHIVAKKPFFKDEHKAQRFAFAQAHVHWTLDNWKKSYGGTSHLLRSISSRRWYESNIKHMEGTLGIA